MKTDRAELPKQKSPIRAIRMMCVQCVGGSKVQDGKDLIRDCVDTACPLYAFRLGENPYQSEAYKKTMARSRSPIIPEREGRNE